LTDNPGLEVNARPVQDMSPVSTFTAQGFSLSLSVGSKEFQTGSSINQLSLQHQTRDPIVVRLSTSASTTSSQMTQQQKIAAALAKAGISNPAAWATAGISADVSSPVQVLEHSSSAPENANGSSHGDAFDLHPAVVIMKETNNKTFLISWRSQKEIARSLGWKCVLMIWGGPVVALLSLYVLFQITSIH
jgi:hypothetical protein